MPNPNDSVASNLMQADLIVSRTNSHGLIPCGVTRFFVELDMTVLEIENFMDEPNREALKQIGEIIRGKKTDEGISAPDDQRHQ